MNIVLGIAAIVAGCYLTIFLSKKLAAHALEIQAQETKTIPEVREALEAMAGIDPNYREIVEVKGTAQAEQPAETPYSKEKVAFYIAKTVQVSETTETYKDSDGNRHTRTVKHSDVLCEEESSVPLLLKDSDGNDIVIETNGVAGKLDLQKTYDRMDMNNTPFMDRPYSHFRHFDIAPRSNYRIIGYKKIEETIRLNAPLYVLGEAYMQDGRIYVGPPKRGEVPYIVTTKSEEQLVKSKKTSQKLSFFGGIACVIVGIVLIVSEII